MFDVIVIGGNISGAFAAINAAEKGTNVALIERLTEPYSPAHCGEGIADVTADFIKIDKFGCPKNEIDNIIINVSSKSEYTFKLTKNKLFIIDRTYLERILLEKAEKTGVTLFLGSLLKKFNPPNELILYNNSKITGKVIIDASGIACVTGRQIGIKKKLKPEDVGVCIQSRVESNFNGHNMYMWWHDPYAPFGYSWLFPKNKNEANIGVGIEGGQKIDLQKLLTEYITFMTRGDYKISHTFRACEPLAPPLDTLVKKNVMYVGDAGRLVDPVSGAGIHNAYFSGTLAGLIAAKYIHGETPSLDVYQELMKNKCQRIKKTYNKKRKLDTSEKFQKGFNRAFSTLHFINKTFPNFFQGHVAKILKKDEKIINHYK